jgi:hypothetical protein
MADAAEILSDYTHREKLLQKEVDLGWFEGWSGISTKPGLSPEALRHVKPYVVRFVEDVRSGKETIDGIPVPVHGGDAGAEPET